MGIPRLYKETSLFSNTTIARGIGTAQDAANTANNRATACRGVCSTAAGTAAKVVESANFTLVQGATVTVYNTTAQTVAGAITLNVNSTGAKAVYVADAATSDANRLLWTAKSTVTFTYDGTCWRVQDKPGVFYGTTCSVAAAVAPKTTTVNELLLFKGAKVSVPMTNANTANATLDVSSLGASNIYYGTGTTAPTTANEYGWKAGSTCTFAYDGKFWRYEDAQAMKDAAEAAKVAGNYIIETSSNDVWVHSEGHGPGSGGAATTNTYGWRIGSVFELVRAGLSFFKMWVENSVAKVRVGLESSGHAIISPDGMEVFKGSSSVAEFGESVRTGLEDGYHSEVSARSIAMKAATDNLFAVNTLQGVTNLHLVSSTRSNSQNGYDDGYASSLLSMMQSSCSIASDGQTVIVTETGEDTGCRLDVPLGQAGLEKRAVLDVMGNTFKTKSHKGIAYNTTSNKFVYLDNYTNEEVDAFVARLNNNGYYVAQDGVTILTSSGADSGYSLWYKTYEDPSVVDYMPYILDEYGNFVESTYRAPSLYVVDDGYFAVNHVLTPQSAIIGAPVDLHVGGIDLRVEGGVAHRGQMPMIPAFIVSSLPSESDMPVLPCLVVNTGEESGIGFYLYQ